MTQRHPRADGERRLEATGQGELEGRIARAPSGAGRAWSAPPRRCADGVRGASLVELLVVLLLLSVMVLVAAQLVTQSVRLLGATAAAVHNPVAVVVTERLRRDVQEARGVAAQAPEWIEDPLELRLAAGRRLRWSVVDGDLVRTTLAPGGAVLDSRIVLRGVVSWWWRTTSPGVVDVSYGYLLARAPETPGSGMPGSERLRRVENLRFAVRGGGGGSGW